MKFIRSQTSKQEMNVFPVMTNYTPDDYFDR